MSQSISSNTLIVVGGTGFVGTAVCREGILNGLNVISISRGGAMPNWCETHIWAHKVLWKKGNALNPKSIEPYFASNDYNIIGVISCVGGFHYSQVKMEQKCGNTNINIAKLAKKYGVKRFVHISRDKTNLTDWWYPFPYIIPGYYKGKIKTENYVKECYKDGNGVCLLSGFVCGKRYLYGLKYIPIPLDLLCGCIKYLCPVIHVDVLSKAAVRFIISNEPSPYGTLVPNKYISALCRK
eukprot:327178_1